MSDRAELLAAIKAKAVIRGDFILSSGQRADCYVDLRRVPCTAMAPSAST